MAMEAEKRRQLQGAGGRPSLGLTLPVSRRPRQHLPYALGVTAMPLLPTSSVLRAASAEAGRRKPRNTANKSNVRKASGRGRQAKRVR
ncbi:hypothetical protein E2562_033014 [Oryza meyeriana var. granulata]|uniref:Uncharacterized protein n=1 Tax=Oryza meyeriana var. granulata TaxID=110450 RepID=A0A6G1CUD7_9ORYZ|nr:hypothetical protein E2562_033014 [Oryza meyeriana var. granulata]